MAESQWKTITYEGVKYDSYASKDDSTYNPGYFHYFQVLGLPNPHDLKGATITPFFKDDQRQINKVLKALKLKKKAPRDVRPTLKNVIAEQNKIWKPRAMHATEYEGGGFEAKVAWAAYNGGLVADEIEVDVNTNQKPSKSTQAELKKFAKDEGKPAPKIKGQRETLKEKFNVEVPTKIKTQVYIIAPKKHIEVARQMVQSLARRREEAAAHRGIGFVRSVIEDTLDDMDRTKMGNFARAPEDIDKGWFEIVSQIFFTTDKDMFERAKIAMGVKVSQPTPKKSATPKA